MICVSVGSPDIRHIQGSKATNRNRIIFETLVERLQHCLFVLRLNDIGSSRKYAEGCLTLVGFRGKIELKQSTKKFRPGLVCREKSAS